MALRIALIADDLTGALDSAAPFAARGLRTKVCLSPDAIEDIGPAGLDVLAVTTNSRETTEAGAASAAARAARLLAPLCPQIVFKKIDSRMKGHVAAEARECAGPLMRSRWLVAPAIPAFGRVVHNGCVEGFGVDTPIDITHRLGGNAEIPDILRHEDFAPLVDAAMTDPGVMLIGARGLAEALAERLGKSTIAPPRPVAPALFAIGSVDPITRRQLERLRAQIGLGEGHDVQEAAGIAILSTAELTGEISATPAQDFALRAARCISTRQPNTLVVAGGETAALVLAALNITRMDVEGETLPGVGQALAETSNGPMRILTKSGGFGPPETLVDLADLMRPATTALRVSA